MVKTRKILNTPGFIEKRYVAVIDGTRCPFVVRIPENRISRPVLLIMIAGDKESVFKSASYNIIPNIFLSAGFNVASFDLPNHGELINRYGEGLEGWANSISEGIDVFEKIRKIGSRIIDIAIEENLAWKQTIVLAGVSRGAFSALHIMAYDKRVYATAAHAPLTDPGVLREFNKVRANNLVVSASVKNLVPMLADRFLFISIGEEDPRVDEKSCFEFYARLSAASEKIKPEMFILQGQTHGKTASNESAYIAGASFLFGKIALKMKERTDQE